MVSSSNFLYVSLKIKLFSSYMMSLLRKKKEERIKRRRKESKLKVIMSLKLFS